MGLLNAASALRVIVEVDYLRQGGYAIVIVRLSVSSFAQKHPNGFAWNFGGRLAMGLNFGCDPDRGPETGKTALAEVCIVPVVLVISVVDVVVVVVPSGRGLAYSGPIH